MSRRSILKNLICDILAPERPQKGFTLIEIMVYITIISVFLVVLTNFTLDIVFTRTKSQSMQEVQQNVRLALLRISREIRSAKDINVGSSVFDSHPGVLSIVMQDDSGKDPTIFDLDNDRLRIKQGSGDYQYLTGGDIKITDLVFTNLSTPDIPRVVKIKLSAERLNPGNKVELKAKASFETSVSMRKKP